MDEVFLNLASANEENRRRAHEIIITSMENPRFTIQMFEILKSADQSNILLLKSVCIVIHEIMKMKWKGDFFDNSLKNIIFEQMIDAIFFIPFEVRSFLDRTISSIFLPVIELFDPIINICTNNLQPMSTPPNISTALLMLSHLACIHTFSKNSAEIEKFIPILIPLILPIISNIKQDLLSSAASNAENRDSPFLLIYTSSVSAIASLIKSFIRRVDFIINNPEFLQLILLLISFLEIPTGPHFESSNTTICEMIYNLLHYWNLNKVITNSFRQTYEENIIPFISNTLLKCLIATNPTPLVLIKSFNVIHRLVMQNLNIDFINESFFQSIVIPSCYLNAEDVSLFTEIPEQFINFYYKLADDDSSDRGGIVSPRIIISNIINIIGQKFKDPMVIDMILNLCSGIMATNSPHNLADFEAKLFIISCITKFRSDNQTLFNFLISTISGDSPPFIVATAICALKNMKLCMGDVNKMSLIILMKSEFVVLKILAVYLFKQTFEPQSTKIDVPLPDLLIVLLPLSNHVKDSAPFKMIDLLIRQYGDSFIPIATELIVTVTNMWINLVGALGEESGRNLLQFVTQIIMKTSSNAEVLMNMTDYLLEFCSRGLFQFREFDFLNDLFDIIFELFDGLSSPPTASYEIVFTLSNFIQSDINKLFFWIGDVVKIFICIVQKPDFFQIEEGKYGKEMIAFCDTVFESVRNTKAISSILFLLSTIVQVSRRCEFANRAFRIFSTDSINEPTFYVSSMCLLSSALVVDPAAIIPMFSEEIINKLLANFCYMKAAEYNHVILCFAGLCMLAKNGCKNAYFCAALFTPTLKKKLKEENEEIDYEQEIANFSNFSNINSSNEEIIYIETPFYPLPSDDLDPFRIFYEISKETHYFSELPEDLKQFISSDVFQEGL